MTEKKLVPASEFDAVQAKLVNLSVKVNMLARLVLVEGKTVADASRELGMSKQLAGHHMKTVKALLNDMPADWVPLNLWVPGWLAIETRAKLKEENERLKNKK